MNMDLVLVMSGWLCALVAIIFDVRLYLQNKQMKEVMKLEKLKIPEDIDPKEVVHGVIEFLDVFWDNPHMKRRAEEIHKMISEALKKWDEEEE